MRWPPRVPRNEWSLGQHFVVMVLLAGSSAVTLSFVYALQIPPETAAAVALAVPLRRARPQRETHRPGDAVRTVLSTVVGWVRAHWRAELAVLVAVDVVLGGLVLAQAGHHLAAMALVFGSLLVALGWITWLLAGDP